MIFKPSRLFAVLAGCAFALAVHLPAQAATGGSEASGALSMVPVAVSVVAPALALSAGGVLAVVAIESTAKGSVWVLQRASDGAKVLVQFSGVVASGAALSVGTAVAVSVVGTGAILSVASQAIAFIPNAVGASLLHHEQVTDKDRVLR